MLNEVEADGSDLVVLQDAIRGRTRFELEDRATRIARLLLDEFKLVPGDHLGMIVGNRVEFMELVIAAILAGLRVTPINWHLTREEVRYICDDSDARVVIVDPAFGELGPTASEQRPVLILDDEFDRLVEQSSARRFDPGGPAGGTMPYTSGTTGRPKGVKRSVKKRLDDQIESLVRGGRLLGLDGSGCHLVTGPMYHAAPGGFALRDLLAGSRVVIMPNWDERECLRQIMKHQVSKTHMVPTMFKRILDLPEHDRSDFDPSSLVTVLHGAAPISIEMKTRMIEWWGKVLVEYWGASEGGVVTLAGSDQWLQHPGTVGTAIPGYEVFAADDDGNRLPTGKTGLLWAHNTVESDVFEYYGAPEKTAASFKSPGIYTLGDIGRVDVDGFVFLSDRTSDVIISGGVNIYPSEVECVLERHHSIQEAVVFGVPNDEWGESVMALVVLKDEGELSPEIVQSIIDFARSHLAGYKVPRSIDVVGDLPRLPSGKLQRRAIRDRFWKDLGRKI